MKIKSVLVWPAKKDGGPSLGWHENCENKSEDTHHSESAAKSICETLLIKGFGCDGHINDIYPLEARVEIESQNIVTREIQNKIIYKWVRGERRPSINEI